MVFEAVRVRGAADHGFAGSAEGLSLGALAESVIENDDVGPLDIFFPIFGLRDEPIGDVTLFFGFDVVADIVAFLKHLPGNVPNETRKRAKETFTFVSFERLPVLTVSLRMMAL